MGRKEKNFPYTIYRDEWDDGSATLIASISLDQLIRRFIALANKGKREGQVRIDVKIEIEP